MKVPLTEDVHKEVCRDCGEEFDPKQMKSAKMPGIWQFYCRKCAVMRIQAGLNKNKMTISVDFREAPELYNELVLWAKKEFRDPANQILYLVSRELYRLQPNTARPWTEGKPV